MLDTWSTMPYVPFFCNTVCEYAPQIPISIFLTIGQFFITILALILHQIIGKIKKAQE